MILRLTIVHRIGTDKRARLLKTQRFRAEHNIGPVKSPYRKLEDRTGRPFAGLEPRWARFQSRSRLIGTNPAVP
jgi:hypothetical protein